MSSIPIFLAVFVEQNKEIVGFILAVIGTKMCLSWRRRRQLRQKRERKRAARKAQIEDLKQKLMQDQTAHTVKEQVKDLSALEIGEKIQSGELKAVDVLHAFKLKALEAHEKTNGVIEFFTEAEEWAKDVDAGRTTGLLAGIPMSIKDHFSVKGYDTTLGFSELLEKPRPEDCVIVQTLKKQGAVPFVKTNITQCLMSSEPSNPIFGCIKNGLNSEVSPGMSSSGEGAIIGIGGSILGMGSDLGGSIRDPASSNGICGFKPTSARVSQKGMTPFLDGQNVVVSSYGPMAKDMSGIVLAMKALWDGTMFELDSKVAPIRFDEKVFTSTRPLRIGYCYEHQDDITAVTTCRRALDKVKSALEDLGHELVPWQPKDAEKVAWMETRCLLGDGGKEIKKRLENDEVDSGYSMIYTLLRTPAWIKRLGSFLTRRLKPYISRGLEALVPFSSVSDYWQHISSVQAAVTEFDESWKEAGLDALIFPMAPYPPLPLELSSNDDISIPLQGNFFLYNVVDYPAGVVPVTKVTTEDIEAMAQYPEHNSAHRILKKTMKDLVDLPVAISAVTARWQDELCLRLMEEIEQASDL